MIRLLRWLARCSLRTLHAWGGVLGWAAYAASPSYRRRLRENAALAGVSPADRRAAVAQAGRLVAELPRLWLRPAGAPIADPVRWEGGALVDEAIAAGRGLLLLTPHMGSFEAAAQSYAECWGAQQPITVLYRPARQRWLRELQLTARTRPGIDAAAADLAGVRRLLRALKRGHTVGLLPDQVPPEGLGTWAPFFGRPAYTMTLAARLVQQTGCAVAVLWCERLARGAGYVAHVEPLPDVQADTVTGAGADTAAALDAAALNRAMEAVIAHRPSQYLWGYHRYKAPRSAGAA